MTNLRILKKQCKRAVAILVRDHGFKPKDFSPAEGDESIYASANMERRFTQWRFKGRIHTSSFLQPGPLKGTLLYWYQCNYECDEWDVKLPTDLLADIEASEAWPKEMGFDTEAA